MPSQLTHRFAALRIYERLPENVRAEISSLPFYDLGAQGPDLFYFLRPYTDRGRLGRRMHGENAFEAAAAFAGCARSPREFSYTAGYVTHCALDSVFHPYVFGITEKLLERGYSDKLSLHGYIASDLDTYLAEKYAAEPRAPYRPEICGRRRFAPLLPFLSEALGRLGVSASERALTAALRRFCLFSRTFTRVTEGRRKFLYCAESAVRANHMLSSRCRRAGYDSVCLNEEEEEMDCVSVLSGHVQDVKFVRFNPSNNNLYSCSYDDTVKVWLYDGEDYSNINTLRAHEGTVWGLAFKQREGEDVQSLPVMEEEEEHHVVSGIGLDSDDGMDIIAVPDDTHIVSEFVTCGMNGKVVYWKEIQGRSVSPYRV